MTTEKTRAANKTLTARYKAAGDAFYAHPLSSIYLSICDKVVLGGETTEQEDALLLLAHKRELCRAAMLNAIKAVTAK